MDCVGRASGILEGEEAGLGLDARFQHHHIVAI